MEEILASIRRIIADEADPATSSTKAPPVPPSKSAAQPAPVAQAPSAPAPKPAAAAPAPAPKPVAAPAAAPAAGGRQDDIDAILAAAGAQEEPDVLELTEPVQGFKQVNAEDVVFREETSEVRMQSSPAPQPRPAAAAPAPSPAPVSAPPAPAPRPAMVEQELLSPDSSAMVNAAFGSLAQTMLGRGRTLEDLVQEMMRPMLKEWLDENLPGLVERMVRAEIERVSRGR